MTSGKIRVKSAGNHIIEKLVDQTHEILLSVVRIVWGINKGSEKRNQRQNVLHIL